MSAGSQPIDNVGSLGIDKEEDAVNVNGAPHYLLKGLERPQPLNSHIFHVCKTVRFINISNKKQQRRFSTYI